MKHLKGYQGIGLEAGKFIPAEIACAYALMQCGIAINDPEAPSAEEFKKMFVEWFYSRNWIEVYDDA